MKKTTITMLCLAACFAAADTKITWLADVTADRAETVTGVQSNQIRDAAAHIVRADNPHGVTAAQIGAITSELDPVANAALAAYAAYWPRNATASSWFNFVTNSGAITITGYNISGGTDVVIPDYINGWPVTKIGASAFAGSGIVSLIAPQTVTSIGDSAFITCHSLASVNIPQVTSIGDYAFYDCASLTSVHMGQNAPAEAADVFADIATTPTVYVTDPQATGWGAVWNGVNVMRLDLHGNLNGNATSATVVTGSQSNLIASAIQAESDPVAMAALTGYQSAAYWPPDATASSWFTFTTNSGAITITGYNIGGGGDVVIPDYINGWPVTGIGAGAFGGSGVTSIGGAGNVVTVGASAFVECILLASVSLPQAQTVGDYAFSFCQSLTSVPLPQVQTVGDSAFDFCTSLTSVPLPQVLTVGDSAFYSCTSLASVYFDNDAPIIGANIFAGITPNQVTIYVTNPTATGWGATLGGMPVVRLPLYADAITLNGDTITEWPVGGGETSIIAPLYDSGTNVTVTSTQSVYSVAVTGAGPVGIDWSGLALDGTGRAEVTLRLNVTEWGGTNVTFSPSLTFDQTPEILVTGVWEFAASTIDGVTTRIRQTWPECCGWQPLVITASGESLVVGTWWQMPVAATNYVYWQAVNRAGLVQMQLEVVNNYAVDVKLYSSYAVAGNTTFSELDVFHSKTVSFPLNSVGGYTVSIAVPQAIYQNRGVKIWVAPVGEYIRIYKLKCRDFNANERAAYAAGWRP